MLSTGIKTVADPGFVEIGDPKGYLGCMYLTYNKISE